MNVVDSSGWLEFFTDGPNAPHFRKLIEKTDELLVPTICLYEVFRHVLRNRSEQEAVEAISAMRRGTMVELTAELALEAAGLGHQLKLAMADAIILATAVYNGATLHTQDADFAGKPHVIYLPKK